MFGKKDRCGQLFKTVLIISLCTLPGLSLSKGISKEKLIEKLADSLENKSQLATNRQLNPKSKLDVTPLFGSWILLYNSGGITFTAKMILEDYEISKDGNDLVYGRFYRDGNSAERRVGCIEDVVDYGYDYKTNYFCMTSDKASPYRIFLLEFSDNGITKGIFTIGDTFDEASSDLSANDVHISGFRSDDSFPLIQTNYYEDSEEIHIPVLNYQGAKYNLGLKHIGNLNFTIQSVEGSSGIGFGEVGLEAIYSEDKEEMLIPMLRYQEATYSVVLKNTGNFVFLLKEIKPIKKAHSGQSDSFISPFLLDPNINPITGGFVWDPVTLFPVVW